jgi:alpha,alpha-trehalose phosphorylase
MRFSLAEKAAAFRYYEGITVRDSSLSATTQAVIAAEVGQLDLAHAYVREAALVDLQDRDDDTGDGLHMASLAGAWIALVCGFGGLRDHHDPSRDDEVRLQFAPRLPEGIRRLAFAVSWRGCCVRVEIVGDRVRYRVEGKNPVQVLHHGEIVTLSPGQPRELGIPALAPLTDPPTQPVGRGPEPLPPRSNSRTADS